MSTRKETLAAKLPRLKELSLADSLTADETAEYDALLAETKSLSDAIDRETQVDAFTQKVSGTINAPAPNVDGDMPKGKSLLDEFKQGGFDPNTRTKGVVPAHVAVKEASYDGATDISDVNAIRVEGQPLGFDERRLYQVFPATGVDHAVTGVDVMRQKSRVLADPGAMIRDIDETSEKPETDSVRELVTLPLKQVASIESGIPNIFMLQQGFANMVNVDLRLAYLEALDRIVVQALAAQVLHTDGDPGTDLTEMIVYAAAEMRAEGYNGTVVALHPDDWAELSLLRGADEVFAREDPLAKFTFVETPSVMSGVPYLIDPVAAGRLYISGVALTVHEENAGATNSSTVRYEGTANFHLERLDAVVRVAAGS